MTSRKFKVLVADDEKLIANNIARKIEETHEAFSVEYIARDGLEAYEVCEKLMPDVVFSDIKMPELDGIGLMERLRSDYPGIKVVIVSGYNDFTLAQSALRNQAVDYLLKPINQTDLKKTLEKIEAELLAREQTLAPRREDKPEKIVQRLMKYMQNNYAQSFDFSDIAAQFNFSGAYLAKIFKEYSGTTPGKYLLDVRMKTAKKLLCDTSLSVKEIAENVGFSDPFHFSKTFKQATNLSPAQFRENSTASKVVVETLNEHESTVSEQ